MKKGKSKGWKKKRRRRKEQREAAQGTSRKKAVR